MHLCVCLQKDALGSASFDLAACLSRPDEWTTLSLPLVGAKAKGTVTLLVRPYCALKLTVVDGVKLRNADGCESLTAIASLLWPCAQHTPCHMSNED